MTIIIVVDGGSGYSWSERFFIPCYDSNSSAGSGDNEDRNLVRVLSCAKLENTRPLHEILAWGKDVWVTWLMKLREALEVLDKTSSHSTTFDNDDVVAKDRSTFLSVEKRGKRKTEDEKHFIFIGLTAGVRNAIESGQVKPESIRKFEEFLHSSLDDTSIFYGAEYLTVLGVELLPREREVSLEFEAAQYCMQLKGLKAQGMISSGGASSQFVYPRNNNPGSKGGSAPKGRDSKPAEITTLSGHCESSWRTVQANCPFGHV